MIDYDEDRLIPLLFRRRGSVANKAAFWAAQAMALCVILKICEDRLTGQSFFADIQIADITKSQLWSAATGVLFVMLGVRTNRALSRFWEGTGLLHQMRGEWFDSVNCCVSFSSLSRSTMPERVMEFRHCIVRLMSLAHASALEEIANDCCDPLVVIDPFGLDDESLEHLKRMKDDGFNRVEILLHMTQTLIVRNMDEGILKIPPPILSRVFQTLSRGFVNLLNAKKIADTKFPFPYVQLIAGLLLLQVLLLPVLLSTVIESTIWSAGFTFLACFGQFSLYYISLELENPFGDDDNDLPLSHFQSEMNNCLLMLLEGNADRTPHTSELRCEKNFQRLVSTNRDNEAEHGKKRKSQHQRITHFASEAQKSQNSTGVSSMRWSFSAGDASPRIPQPKASSISSTASTASPRDTSLVAGSEAKAGSPRRESQDSSVCLSVPSPRKSPSPRLKEAMAPAPTPIPFIPPKEATRTSAFLGSLEKPQVNGTLFLGDSCDPGKSQSQGGASVPSETLLHSSLITDLLSSIDAKLPHMLTDLLSNIDSKLALILTLGAEVGASILDTPAAPGLTLGKSLLLSLEQQSQSDATASNNPLGARSMSRNALQKQNGTPQIHYKPQGKHLSGCGGSVKPCGVLLSPASTRIETD